VEFLPADNNILEVGRKRIELILIEVILKDMDLILSGVERFINVDGCSVEFDELEDVLHTQGDEEVLAGISGNDHATIEDCG
jgi:hypothetical protein